jgi:hypothetical protein
MNTLFRHFLLLLAILGFVGQGVAYAFSPCAAMAMDQSVSGSKMADRGMGSDKVNKDQAPHKNMTPGCMAMAGCSTPAAIAIQAPTMCEPRIAVIAATWPVTHSLHGIDVSPEQHPPSILG